MYRELRRDELPIDLGAAVVWQRTPEVGDGSRAAEPYRIVPDGCLDLIWIDGDVLVAGPDTRAHLSPRRDTATYVGIRFAAGTGPEVLGVAADELRDTRTPLGDLWSPADARRLVESVDAAADRPAALARAVWRRWAEPDPLTLAVWRSLRAGARVGSTADAIGLSARQLHRRCLYAFGYGPKTLARVLRFDRALALARTGTPLAAVATTTGYADQAHLSREVRDLAGVPLTILLS